MVERPICNRMVVGSIPTVSKFHPAFSLWGCRIAAIARDCKSLTFGFRWFESNRPQLAETVLTFTLAVCKYSWPTVSAFFPFHLETAQK